MTRETYDWHEAQRQRAREQQTKLRNEARSMGTPELLRALSWQEALNEHGSEIGQSYDRHGKTGIIRDELRRRGRL